MMFVINYVCIVYNLITTLQILRERSHMTSARFCLQMELAVCDVFQAALKRHKKENICKTTYEECWLPDEDAQLEQLEWRLVSVEELPVVDVEAVQTTAWVVFLKS